MRSNWKIATNLSHIKDNCILLRRNTVIGPFSVHKTSKVHNGKEFKTVSITPDMVGEKIGDFSFTRKTLKHKIK